ncbi:hypothetical protein [Fischerella sp. JS2]|uniref:hypothetical protein n=1 Tax=Fischerella sp. JS2 TaxID=2597771 RepID=UPI0028F16CA9|nr:hypothetical protein [Fischerella sp. JS2]
MQSRGVSIEPDLNASLEFVFGLEDYICDRIDSASEHFQHSFQFWQQQREDKEDKEGQGGQGKHLYSPHSTLREATCVSTHSSRPSLIFAYCGHCDRFILTPVGI